MFILNVPHNIAGGQLSNWSRKDNARAEGESIIYLRPLLNCPSALISPVMHCQVVYKVFSALTDLRQPQFCWALFRSVYSPDNAHSSVHKFLMYGHVIDFETSDSSKFT